jgi:hypothetical protein
MKYLRSLECKVVSTQFTISRTTAIAPTAIRVLIPAYIQYTIQYSIYIHIAYAQTVVYMSLSIRRAYSIYIQITYARTVVCMSSM